MFPPVYGSVGPRRSGSMRCAPMPVRLPVASLSIWPKTSILAPGSFSSLYRWLSWPQTQAAILLSMPFKPWIQSLGTRKKKKVAKCDLIVGRLMIMPGNGFILFVIWLLDAVFREGSLSLDRSNWDNSFWVTVMRRRGGLSKGSALAEESGNAISPQAPEREPRMNCTQPRSSKRLPSGQFQPWSVYMGAAECLPSLCKRSDELTTVSAQRGFWETQLAERRAEAAGSCCWYLLVPVLGSRSLKVGMNYRH